MDADAAREAAADEADHARKRARAGPSDEERAAGDGAREAARRRESLRREGRAEVEWASRVGARGALAALRADQEAYSIRLSGPQGGPAVVRARPESRGARMVRAALEQA